MWLCGMVACGDFSLFRPSHLFKKLKNPFSEGGHTSIGTWFLCVIRICNEIKQIHLYWFLYIWVVDVGCIKTWIKFLVCNQYQKSMVLTVHGPCIHGSPSICIGNVFFVVSITSLHCANRRPDARSPVFTSPNWRQFFNPITSIRLSPMSVIWGIFIIYYDHFYLFFLLHDGNYMSGWKVLTLNGNRKINRIKASCWQLFIWTF